MIHFSKKIQGSKKALVAAGVVFLSAFQIAAEDTANDYGIPTVLSESQFEALREHSPFTRVLDFSETLRLTGIAMIDGEQVATVRDRTKEKSYVISSQTNENGWKMVGVESSVDLKKSSATISVNGGEHVTVQFDEKQLHPEQNVKGTKSIKVSKGPDRRPPSTHEERRKFGEWIRGRMSKMSEDQRKRVGEIMREKMKANPKLSDRQKGEVFVKILDHVESGK
jgi:hypothetical protein